MAYIARKPFLFNGTKYLPGDVVKGFPEEFFKSESFIHAGFVVEKKPEEVKPIVTLKKTTKVKSGA